MGLLRKKEKRSKLPERAGVSDGTDADVTFSTKGYESKHVQDVDSALSGLRSSPSATDNSSVSAANRTEGAGAHVMRKQGGGDSKGPWFTSRQMCLFRTPPPADQAAYAGPPRYDWVDIETSAAIKVQAAYRRKRVMSMMEKEGRTTAAVRNRARRRQAAKEARTNPARDFINLFSCCGVDLGLGGGNKEKYWDFTRELETARYAETTRERAKREEMLRKKYQRKPPRENLIENVEVVQ